MAQEISLSGIQIHEELQKLNQKKEFDLDEDSVPQEVLNEESVMNTMDNTQNAFRVNIEDIEDDDIDEDSDDDLFENDNIEDDEDNESDNESEYESEYEIEDDSDIEDNEDNEDNEDEDESDQEEYDIEDEDEDNDIEDEDNEDDDIEDEEEEAVEPECYKLLPTETLKKEYLLLYTKQKQYNITKGMIKTIKEDSIYQYDFNEKHINILKKQLQRTKHDINTIASKVSPIVIIGVTLDNRSNLLNYYYNMQGLDEESLKQFQKTISTQTKAFNSLCENYIKYRSKIPQNIEDTLVHTALNS